MEGRYAAENPEDLWPGDLLNVPVPNGTVAMMVREVEMRDLLAWPEVWQYQATLANDWAKPLSMRVTPAIAADVLLPLLVTPMHAPESLNAVTVVSVSGTAVQLDMGVTAPAGGGFELRRRDGGLTGREAASW